MALPTSCKIVYFHSVRSPSARRISVVIPGSKNPDHIRDNFDIFDFSLSDEDMKSIAAVDKGVRYYTATPELIAQYAKMELKPDL